MTEIESDKIKYEHLFGTTMQQKDAIVIFKKHLEKKSCNMNNTLLTNQGFIWTQALIVSCAVVMHFYNLIVVLVVYPLGNKNKKKYTSKWYTRPHAYIMASRTLALCYKASVENYVFNLNCYSLNV